jgi:hypothetical protein
MTTLMTAALPASTTLVPTSADAPRLPAELTVLDAARITAAIAASKSETTRTVYGHVRRQWERWCDGRGIPALPADPLALCAYLTEHAEAGRATSTLDMSCTGSGTSTGSAAPPTPSPRRQCGRCAAPAFSLSPAGASASTRTSAAGHPRTRDVPGGAPS